MANGHPLAALEMMPREKNIPIQGERRDIKRVLESSTPVDRVEDIVLNYQDKEILQSLDYRLQPLVALFHDMVRYRGKEMIESGMHFGAKHKNFKMRGPDGSEHTITLTHNKVRDPRDPIPEFQLAFIKTTKSKVGDRTSERQDMLHIPVNITEEQFKNNLIDIDTRQMPTGTSFSSGYTIRSASDHIISSESANYRIENADPSIKSQSSRQLNFRYFRPEYRDRDEEFMNTMRNLGPTTFSEFVESFQERADIDVYKKIRSGKAA